MAIEAAFVVPHPPLILPEVGKGEERGIQATIDSYTEVGQAIRDIAPDVIVVSSPHAPLYRDGFYVGGCNRFEGDMMRFRAPRTRLDVPGHPALAQAIQQACAREPLIPVALDTQSVGELDHASFIPLFFADAEVTHTLTVIVGLSALGPEWHRLLGERIAEAIDQLGLRAVYVASGDLSHKLLADGPYGLAPEGPVFDRWVMDVLGRGDWEALWAADPNLYEAAAECGLRSFWIMAGALEKTHLKPSTKSYEGPFGVGYGVVTYQ